MPWQRAMLPYEAARRFPRSKSECVADSLGRAIVAGDFLAGEPLPAEPVLLEQFGVSRTSMRDALRFLSGKGLIEACQWRGTSVTPTSRWNRLDPIVIQWQAAIDAAGTLGELLQLRQTIYPVAAALAASAANKENIAAIDAQLEALEANPSPADQWRQMLIFHHAVVEAGGNNLFTSMSHLICGTLLSGAPPRRTAAARAEAMRLAGMLAGAVRRGDAAEAEFAMRTSLQPQALPA